MDKSICIILPNYITRLIGGAELQSYFLAEGLLAKGWKVEVISSFVKPEEKNANPEYANPNIKFSHFKETALISAGFFLVLFKLLRTRSAYYYVRTDYPHVGAVGLFCRLTSKKMIYACADNECFYVNRYSRQIKREDYKSYLHYLIRKIDLAFVDRMIVFGKKAAHYFVAQTNEQKSRMLEVFGKDALIIRNSFKITRSSISTKENIVLWVGNLRSIKQPEVFLCLYNAVKSTNYRFVVIGERDKKYSAFPGDTDADFTYLGKLNLEQTEEWIAKSRFMVNTSSSEGFSNTFIQAWFYKTYILSLNADPDNLFSEGGLGWVANGDFELMKEHLERLMNSPEQVKESLQKAQLYAMSEFSADQNVGKFENMLIN